MAEPNPTSEAPSISEPTVPPEDPTAPEQATALEEPQTQPNQIQEQEPIVPADPQFQDYGAMNGSAVPLPPDQSAMMNGFGDPSDPSYMVPALDQLQPPIIIPPTIQPITADEIALYDRQIRLWGVKAQEKIRGANLLLIGMKALGNEIAKNLVLAGVGTLTIMDHELVTEEDLGSQFFISQDSVGHNRALTAQVELQKLNPRVNLFTDPDVVFTKMPEYFSTFDVTIATALPLDALSSINMYCRMFNRKFYAADTHGMYGYIFADLVIHDFVVEKEKTNKISKAGDVESPSRSILSVTLKEENNKAIEVVTKQEIYSPLLLANSSPLPLEINRNRRSRMKVTPLLSCLRALFDFQRERNGLLPGHNRQDLELFTRLANERHLELTLPIETLRAEFLRSFLQNLGSEISPVVAFLGGRLAQDVINVLGQREQPLQNFLLFDGEELKSSVYGLHPIFDDTLSMPMDMNGGGMNMEMPVGLNGEPVAV